MPADTIGLIFLITMVIMVIIGICRIYYIDYKLKKKYRAIEKKKRTVFIETGEVLKLDDMVYKGKREYLYIYDDETITMANVLYDSFTIDDVYRIIKDRKLIYTKVMDHVVVAGNRLLIEKNLKDIFPIKKLNNDET